MQFRYIVSAGLCAWMLFTSCNHSPKEPEASSPANEAVAALPPVASTTDLPAFKMFDIQGNPVQLASLKGKKIFLNMWASWCPPCRMEMPSIYSLYKKTDKEKTAFVFLTLDESMEDAAAFIKAQGMNIPIYMPAENPPALLNVQGIPATFIFNESGALLKKMEGMDDYDTEAYINLLKG